MKSAVVFGAGSWGTALAAMLAERGLHVQLWGRDETLMREIAETRKNSRYLPTLKLPREIMVTHRMEELKAAELAVIVIPSKGLRSVAGEMKKAGVFRGGELLLSCTKGIELETGEQMSEIIGEIFPQHSLAALSGPNHAEEIAQQLPSAAVVASENPEVAVQLQGVFTLPWFRCYTSDDLTGVEWAGAMKNPYAIAAGIARGLNLGDNAIAALVTRALAEMVRFGVKQGGRVETFYGLSGVGDLVATCYSEHSRNNRVGKLLGQGKSLADIIAGTRMVAEGVPNTESLWRCARKIEASTPLLDEIYAMLYQGKPPKEALRELLGRDPRPEVD
ncbi:MAG: NAD(P)-dependent glycerol-3-phosphate dehydrogenase [Verrucomicrobia bacterium]|nr:NAD(P)-dependent glycerol-3-phosphate dehydrogenase [Verrucomicrobiota bacterium]